MEQAEYYTVDEVAALLKTTPSTIAIAIRNGRLHAVKVGHSYRIPKSAIDAFVKAQSKNASR